MQLYHWRRKSRRNAQSHCWYCWHHFSLRGTYFYCWRRHSLRYTQFVVLLSLQSQTHPVCCSSFEKNALSFEMMHKEEGMWSCRTVAAICIVLDACCSWKFVCTRFIARVTLRAVFQTLLSAGTVLMEHTNSLQRWDNLEHTKTGNYLIKMGYLLC
jgi:hypothetical protein